MVTKYHCQVSQVVSCLYPKFCILIDLISFFFSCNKCLRQFPSAPWLQQAQLRRDNRVGEGWSICCWSVLHICKTTLGRDHAPYAQDSSTQALLPTPQWGLLQERQLSCFQTWCWEGLVSPRPPLALAAVISCLLFLVRVSRGTWRLELQFPLLLMNCFWNQLVYNEEAIAGSFGELYSLQKVRVHSLATYHCCHAFVWHWHCFSLTMITVFSYKSKQGLFTPLLHQTQLLPSIFAAL